MIYIASACFLDSKNTPVSKIDELKYTFPCFHELLLNKHNKNIYVSIN